MSARLIQVYLLEEHVPQLEAILGRHSRRFWRETVPGDQEKFSCIAQQRYTERLLDELEAEFAGIDHFNVYVQTLEAVFPPVEETPETEIPDGGRLKPPNAIERFFSRDRLSTDEIFDDIERSLHLRPSYLLMVTLSTIIAGLGMRSGQTAVVIGAMVIAPLLGPTMGMALAATVGDRKLGWRATATLAVGTGFALLAGWLLGVFVPFDPTVAELNNRTIVQLADIALALACGAAGVLAFTRGASLTLVGVMIAVALVPPLAAAGMYSGAGHLEQGADAFFLFSINLVCVNVAGIAMLLIQGLPPKSWRLTGGILALWLGILAILAAMAAGRLVLGLGT